MSVTSPYFSGGGALNKRNICLTVFCILIATLWNISTVSGAPAKLDSLESPFPLDLQPPVFEAASSATSFGDSDGQTIDSYGNPIESLQPIETPDGRKVVSAQGLQFEIPNYASGITELKKPADDLLPPFVDPIVVALPAAGPDSLTKNTGPLSISSSSSSAETTTVDVESIPLVEIKTDTPTAQSSSNPQFVSTTGKFQGLPDYILELNDPNIQGPVDYIPDDKGLKVIAWDLLPPYEADAETVNANNNEEPSHAVDPVSHKTEKDLESQYSQTSQSTLKPQIVSGVSTETTTKPNYAQQHRGTVHYSSTTERPATTTTRRSTTTTLRTTTTPRTTPRTTTTTTRRTTTPRTTSTTTTTTAEPDSSEFFKLEAGDSYTLPPWLQDIDDPELDVAVTYIVPEDINNYNHTIDTNILPPLEPYTDLNNLHLTSPATNDKDTTSSTATSRFTTTPRSTTTTTRRTTTTTTARPKTASTSTTTTTTTRRPTLSTSQPHWIRVKPTTKPTTSVFNNQFTTDFNHNQASDTNNPSIASSNFAQRTTSTIKPKTTVNYYNRPPLSNTPKTDKITSSEEAAGIPQKSQNPFLPTYSNGAYRPQTYSTTTRRTTTTTTTTTTPAPDVVDENPFEPTIPPWLKDFDYPDVGAGVPFVYDPTEDESAVDKNILPPSSETSSETNNKPTFIASPSSSAIFLNSQTSHGFTNKFSNSDTSLTSSSSIPSKVTIPLPSIQQTIQDDSTVTQPPLVFEPPPPTPAENNIIANADAITKKTSSFNTNFAAHFDATASTTVDDTKKVPLGADRESFPPFNAVTDGVTGATLPSKTTFSKSEDGKVITNNVFLNGGAGGEGATLSKPFATSSAVNNQQKDTFATQSNTQLGAQVFSGSTFTKATTASTSFNQFGTTSAGASGFVTAGGASSSFDSTTFGSSSSSNTAGGFKYTGRFGGPAGILAPQSSGFTTASPVTKTYNSQAAKNIGSAAASSSSGSPSSGNYKFTGSFGGPPGVLQPYDNVKNHN